MGNEDPEIQRRLQTTSTHSDGIGVPDEFVDVKGLSAQLPGVML